MVATSSNRRVLGAAALLFVALSGTAFAHDYSYDPPPDCRCHPHRYHGGGLVLNGRLDIGAFDGGVGYAYAGAVGSYGDGGGTAMGGGGAGSSSFASASASASASAFASAHAGSGGGHH